MLEFRVLKNLFCYTWMEGFHSVGWLYWKKFTASKVIRGKTRLIPANLGRVKVSWLIFSRNQGKTDTFDSP